MNIRDIARIANVTPGTVSKVLNNYPDISDATRQHVLHIIEEYQYSPHQNVKSKAASAPSQIGLVVEGVYNSLYSSLQEELSRRLHNADYTIMFFNDNYFVQDKHEKFQELLSYIDRHNLCGLIYIGFPALPYLSIRCCPPRSSKLPIPAYRSITLKPPMPSRCRS